MFGMRKSQPRVPSSRDLAQRDPAAAAFFGFLTPNAGADFGNDDGFGFGFGFGADAIPGIAPPPPPLMTGAVAAVHPGAPHIPHPTPHAAMALWHHHHMKKAHNDHRELLLDPNKHATTKVERYVFPLNQGIVVGTSSVLAMSAQPDTRIRPQRVTTNAPSPMFAFLQDIKVANVSVTVGGGSGVDAYDFAAGAFDSHLDMPTLEPSNKATVIGSYSGLIPPGFLNGMAATFVVSFKGPSTMAG